MICILTLRLDGASQDYFEELRLIHFPRERNHTPAHLTLFHQLPDSGEVLAMLEKRAAACSRFPLKVAGLRSLGGGVAYALESPALVELRSELAAAFEPHLTAQDKQKFMPHITVQNKVTSDEARTLMARLQARPTPPKMEACGMDLWEYLGGPWRYLQTFPFTAEPDQVA
jgi:2'-5' RNA ligase